MIVCFVGTGIWCGVTARADDLYVEAGGGRPGAFTSVQAAVDAAPAGTADNRTRIYINPGVYHERITVPADKPFVSFIGTGESPGDVVLTFDLHARSPMPDGGEGVVGTTGSTSTFINATDFVAENVTFANATPDNVAQAVAIKPQADRLVFYNCRFEGFQDTLYPMRGRQYYLKCYITGDTDFIFGDATAVFDRCTIHSSDSSYLTAASTLPPPEGEHGFVFLDCELIAAEGVPADSTYLGRPWKYDRGSVASVTFIRTKMGPHIKAAGWHPWHADRNTEPEKTTRYAEFGSTDPDGNPLDVSGRVEWSRQLTAEEAGSYTVENLLSGDDGWEPTAGVVTLQNQTE